MPRTNGIATLPSITWSTPGTTIRAEQHNSPFRDVEAMLTNSLPRDGSAPMQGDIPMGGNRITGLAAAVDDGDAVRFDQALPRSGWLASVSALTFAANEFPYATGPSTAAKASLTAFARTLLDDETAAAARDTLALKAGAVAPAQTQAAWNSGEATEESVISPAKARAATRAQFSASGNAPTYAVRAWGVINGGNGNLTSGGNVSVSRESTGIFVITFTTPMPSASYAISAVSSRNEFYNLVSTVRNAPTASGFSVVVRDLNGSLTNPLRLFITVTC